MAVNTEEKKPDCCKFISAAVKDAMGKLGSLSMVPPLFVFLLLACGVNSVYGHWELLNS